MTGSGQRDNADQPGKRILFYVQHLLGVGHVFRAQRLCEGFTAAGLSVEVIFGGEPLPKMKFAAKSIHFLPPIKAGAIDYSFNVDAKGNSLSHAYMANRQKILLDIFDGIAPDMILFEAWPFGRRIIRHEIKAMLDIAKTRPNPPLVFTSVRDILQEGRKPGRSEEAVKNIGTYVDKVLVHSDPALIKLDATFPLADQISDKLYYTGFVRAQPKERPQPIEKFDVIVTIGGGAFGEGLIKTALQARALSTLSDAHWCLCTGPNLPADIVEYLKQNCPDGVTIKTFLLNLARHLEHAKLSISQVGYNTSMDALSACQTGECKAVFVPSDIAGQTEQLRRAELLQDKGYAINLPESKLTPQALANAIDRAMALPAIQSRINFSGVENSAAFIVQTLENRAYNNRSQG
jgi:predicted glycosyltransferase